MHWERARITDPTAGLPGLARANRRAALWAVSAAATGLVLGLALGGARPDIGAAAYHNLRGMAYIAGSIFLVVGVTGAIVRWVWQMGRWTMQVLRGWFHDIIGDAVFNWQRRRWWELTEETLITLLAPLVLLALLLLAFAAARWSVLTGLAGLATAWRLLGAGPLG